MISLENNRNFRCAVKPNKKSTCFFDWSIVGRACFCLLKSSETYPDATNVWDNLPTSYQNGPHEQGENGLVHSPYIGASGYL